MEIWDNSLNLSSSGFPRLQSGDGNNKSSLLGLLWGLNKSSFVKHLGLITSPNTQLILSTTDRQLP